MDPIQEIWFGAFMVVFINQQILEHELLNLW